MTMADRSSGFTLTEFMLAVLIGSFLLLGVMKMYITITRNYGVTLQYAKLQEKMRMTYRILQDEINMAGNYACGNTPNVNNMLNQSDGDWWNTAFAYGVYGIDSETASLHTSADNNDVWPQAIRTQAREDSDVVLLANMTKPVSVSGLSEDRKSIYLKYAYDYEPVKVGALWLLCDVSDTVFFQSGHQLAGNNDQGVSISMSQSDELVVPGNQQLIIDHNFTEGSQVGRMLASILFVAPSVSKNNYSLFREYLTFTKGQVKSRREELIVGIENLQFEYGLMDDEKDTNYYSAHQVNAMNAWSQVMSVKVGVLFASEDNVLKKIGAHQFTIANQYVTVKKDKRQRVLMYFLMSIKSR